MGLLDGKVALVTAFARGIGREIALSMPAAGAKVLVSNVGASLQGSGSQHRPCRSSRRAEDWTAETLVEQAPSASKPSLASGRHHRPIFLGAVLMSGPSNLAQVESAIPVAAIPVIWAA